MKIEKEHLFLEQTINLSKVCALEDAEHGCDDGVAQDAAQVGVHRHLES